MNRNVTVLFHAGDVAQDVQQDCDIYPTLLPVCTVVMAIGTVCKYTDRVFGYTLNPCSHYFCFILNNMSKPEFV
jgi:hypothetical protein